MTWGRGGKITLKKQKSGKEQRITSAIYLRFCSNQIKNVTKLVRGG